jgi:hypothetical protein
MKPTNSNYLLHCYIAGLQYYEVLEVWKDLQIGQFVQLIPEPENPHDPNAVGVAYGLHKLGYLPRSQNKAVSKILPAGHDAYEARIQSLYSQNPMDKRIEICLKMKQPSH